MKRHDLIDAWLKILLASAHDPWRWDCIDAAVARIHWPPSPAHAGGYVSATHLSYVEPSEREIAHGLNRLGYYRDARLRWQWKGRPYSIYVLRHFDFWAKVPKQFLCDYYDCCIRDLAGRQDITLEHLVPKYRVTGSDLVEDSSRP